MSNDPLSWGDRARKEALDVLTALNLHREMTLDKEIPPASLAGTLDPAGFVGPSVSLEMDNEVVIKQPLPSDRTKAYLMALSLTTRSGQIRDVHRLVEAASEELTEVQMVQLLAAVLHSITLMERDVMKLIRSRGHSTPRARLHNFPKKGEGRS